MVEANIPNLLDIGSFLDAQNSSLKLILLNQKLNDGDHLKSLLAKAEVIVCADGGSNRLYDYD
jgi:hypothetical protein